MHAVSRVWRWIVPLMAMFSMFTGCRVGFGPPCWSDADCDDANPCTDDVCLLPDGCQITFNQAGCDDGDDCSGTDVCRMGVCQGGEIDRDNDGDGWVDGNCPGGDDCDDSNADVNPGVSESLSSSLCGDLLDNDCDGMTDIEDLECRSCTNDGDCDDGDICTGQESCSGGSCQEGELLVCDDGLYCNGAESCDPQAGCLPGAAPCAGPDGDADCRESCDEVGDGCTLADPDGSACADDGLYCNGPEVCLGAVCLGAGSPCGALYCDENRDLCETWYDLGGSDFGPWLEFLWSSCWGGGISANGGESTTPSVALDETGHPVVAWQDRMPGISQIYIKRFDGSEWVEVGAGSASGEGISPGGDWAYNPSVALDAAGYPLVAWWVDLAGNREIYLKRYDSESFAWVELGAGSASAGGISQNAGNSSYPVLVLDAAGSPVVAWQDQSSGNYEIYLKRYDPESFAWQEVGAGSASAGGISQNAGTSAGPSLDLDVLDNPVVAWSDQTTGTRQIYVLRWDGGAWVEVGAGSASGGGISMTAGDSYTPSLALDDSDNPVVAWETFTGGAREIYVKRYDGGAWVEVGVGSASGGGISATGRGSWRPRLALDNSDNPVVVWTGETGEGINEIFMLRYDGVAWVEVGAGSSSGQGVSANQGWSTDPAMALDGAGHPVLAWTDLGSGYHEIYVKSWDGAAWGQVGTGTGSGGGISENPGESKRPTLALDDSGNPVVAWTDNTSGNDEIYAMRYDAAGAAWVEVGAGSASGGGVSANPNWSRDPALALDGSGQPLVAWHDISSGNSEIYIMRFDSAADGWAEVGAGSATGGGISGGGNWAESPALALDGADNPVVAWFSGTFMDYDIYLKRFDDASGTWVEVGAGSASGGGISANAGWSKDPTLALDSSDYPVVAWMDEESMNQEIFVKRYDAASGDWVELGAGSAAGGGISSNAGRSGSPTLVVDGLGDPLVAWEDDTPGNYEIYVMRFDAASGSWVEMGPGSASSGGISNNPGGSREPSMALDGAGHPVVAWSDDTSGSVEIVAKRYEGGSWVELGFGSLPGGVVSNSAGASTQVSLAIRGGRTCLAWQEGGPESIDIVLRCTQ